MLSAARIRQLLEALNAELAADSVRGEIYLAGGAVMCLVFRAREATKDVDALLVPAAELRRAARRVSEREGPAVSGRAEARFETSGRLTIGAIGRRIYANNVSKGTAISGCSVRSSFTSCIPSDVKSYALRLRGSSTQTWRTPNER